MLNRPHLIIHDRAFAVGTALTKIEAVSSILMRSNDEKSIRQIRFSSERVCIAQHRSTSVTNTVPINHARYDCIVNSNRAV